MSIHLICDLIFVVGNFVLALSLSPSIRHRVRVPRLTTLPTALVLSTFVVCYMLLELYLAAASVGLLAVGWYVLYFRR